MSPAPRATPPNRELIVADIVERTGLDEAMLGRVVAEFYRRARRDPLIGPIFETRVEDWDAHVARVSDFWSSVVLMSGRYHGNPMAAHAPLPVGSAEFDRWLEIFATTVLDLCPGPAASFLLGRAHRIADSLELGIELQKGRIPRKRERPASTSRPAG